MYLHIGQNVVVPTDTIVGIFDMDTVTLSKHTRAFLSALEKNGRLIPLFDDLPKSCVHCVEKGNPSFTFHSFPPRRCCAAAEWRSGNNPQPSRLDRSRSDGIVLFLFSLRLRRTGHQDTDGRRRKRDSHE